MPEGFPKTQSETGETHPPSRGRSLPTTPGESDEAPPVITLRAVLLGLLTIAAMFYYFVQVGQRLNVGSYVHSQFPMAAWIPFVLWLFLNVGLKRIWPRVALRRGELLTIFSMMWVVGTIPQRGWIDFWASILAAPTYFASPENRWAEIFFDYLPWHVFADTSPRVIDPFWFGLPEGMSIPWDGWVGIAFHWAGVSLAMVVFAFCLILLFQRQWVEEEKLSFPLAQMPLDLTRGMDGPRRMPDIFRSYLFWLGFGAVFVPILYNVGTYFIPGLPQIELYWKHYFVSSDDRLFWAYFRIQPLVLAATYLCPVDILGSLVLFYLLAALKLGLMHRVGFSVGGFTGIFGEAYQILYMESYGALFCVGLWWIWLARRHLRGVWRQVRSGEGSRAETARYRLAVVGLLLSASYVIGWAVSLGMNLPVAIGAFLLMTLTYFVTAKLVAATGFAYLFPNRPQIKGESFVVELVGSIYLSPRNLIAFKTLTSRAFFGTFMIPAWPAITHHLRIFSFRRQPGWVAGAVFVAFPVGFLVAAWATVELAYQEGGMLFLGGKANLDFQIMAHLMNNRGPPTLGRWAVWLWGFLEAAGIALMRARFHWFPLHPIGLVFQFTFGTWLYWFSLCLILLVKLVLLRYGGVQAYQTGKPFFYGLGIGYVIGVMLSASVDLIWFPTAGHRMHWW